jgi:putative redox protein
MATVYTKYLGTLRTEATHIQSKKVIITDAPTDNNGKGEAFSPTDLVATALTSCMMTIMGIEANKLGVTLTGLEAETTKIMSASPRKISAIKIRFSALESDANEEQIGILKKAALSCPVALSLDPQIRQEVEFDGF